ncbi:Detected protein of confused Function [Hibiscus syriacus]|uniref:Detected protein of confused Function n=1 Tax=Hibiscus syriacus TaxID=106335 RepID=A0A6A3C0J2_HIBSY|nr:Detected protein of confused Function [Hibiscus syriacus]
MCYWNIQSVFQVDAKSFLLAWAELRSNSLIWSFIPGVVLWTIWKTRNFIVFEGGKLDQAEIFFLARFRLASWFLAKNSQVSISKDCLIADPSLGDSCLPYSNRILSKCPWSPPPKGFIKLNVDAATTSDWKRSGLGGVLKDVSGSILASFKEPAGPGPPTMMELKVILKGMVFFESIRQRYKERLIIESDSRVAVDWDKDTVLCPAVYVHIVKDIIQKLKDYEGVIRWVNRTANLEADVYKRSFEVCMQLYEKEILTENSYLHIYGLQVAGFNSEQLAIVAGLCEWRDNIARVEDESTGYVLPNKTLLEIAKQMPVTAHKLRRLLKSKHPYVERNLGVLVSIIRQSMQNAVAFEAAAQQLKMGRTLSTPEHIASNKGAKVLLPEVPADSNKGPDGITAQYSSPQHKQELINIGSSITELDTGKKQGFSFEPHVNGSSMHARENLASSWESGDANASTVIAPSAKATEATILILKKPSRGLGALLGNASIKKKVGIEKMEKEESKLAQIRSSVNFSFHSFLGTEELSKTPAIEPTKLPEVPQPEDPSVLIATESSTVEDVIMLEDNSNKDEQIDGSDNREVTDRPEETSMTPSSEIEKEDETMSLSDLSTSFQLCFESMNQNTKAVKVKKSKEPSGLLQIKSFDYEAARKEVKFGEDAEEESGSHTNYAGKKKKGSAVGRLEIDDGSKQFPQARRRQAFPASGNRSATFR